MCIYVSVDLLTSAGDSHGLGKHEGTSRRYLLHLFIKCYLFRVTILSIHGWVKLISERD